MLIVQKTGSKIMVEIGKESKQKKAEESSIISREIF